jgi:hypothetical protein
MNSFAHSVVSGFGATSMKFGALRPWHRLQWDGCEALPRKARASTSLKSQPESGP